MADPIVSVVISTYNRSGLLRRSLQTVLDQSLQSIEVIVVDNGSDDDTPAMLAAWRDPRVRVVRNEVSLGPTGGRNTGLSRARGVYVALVDDDDLWAADKLRDQVDALAATGRNWAYTGCVYIDRDERVLGGVPPLSPEEVMAVLPCRYVVPAGVSSMMWRRGVLDGEGLLDPGFTYATDWDLSLRLARSGPPAAVPRPHVAYRLHPHQISIHANRYAHEFDLIEAKFADMRGSRRLARWGHHRYAGSMALISGDRSGAAVSYLRAVLHGDVSSLARLVSVPLPLPIRAAAVRRLRGKAAWLAEAEQWLRRDRTAPRIANARMST